MTQQDGTTTRDTKPVRVPADYPKWGVSTQCDGHRPFLAVGEDEVTIVACQRSTGQHVAMSADCDCCDCAAHKGPSWTSLRWNRHTPGALPAVQVVPDQEGTP